MFIISFQLQYCQLVCSHEYFPFACESIANSYANSPILHTNIFLSGVCKKDYFRMRKEYFRMRKEYFRMIRNSDREARTPTPRSF